MPIIRLQKYNKIIPYEPVLHWNWLGGAVCVLKLFCVIVLRLG